MSQAIHTESYQVIWLIRRLFRALSQKSNANLEEFGICVADRAIMEFLYPDKKLSVPEIAKQYQVSRQHVQTTINTLLAMSYVTAIDNPKHKRSPLFELNPAGRELFESVLKKDEEVVNMLFSAISKNNIEVTRQTLQSLLAELS